MEFNDIWRLTNFYAVVILTGLLCLRLYKRLGPVLTLTWAYFLIRGLFVFMNPQVPSIPQIGMALDQVSGQAFAQLLVIPLMVLLLPDKIFKHWQNLFLLFGLLECALLVIFGYGFFNAHSFDAAMIAQLIPFAPTWMEFIYFAAIATAKSGATAIVMIAAMLMAYAVRVKKYRWPIIGLTVLALALARFYLPQVHGFDSSGRIPAWIRFFVWWQHDANFFFGTGTGTFLWIGPYIDGLKGEVFLQMHNDWLQVLFEGGLVGLILVAMSYCYLLIHSWKDPRLFMAVVGLGFFALTYHPLRFFFSQLFIACLIRVVKDSQNK